MRSTQILSRFPAHLEAARPGKLLGTVAQAGAVQLDALAAALAAVRRAHRLVDADELADLWRLAALHGMALAEFEVLLGRFRRAGELLATLTAAADDSSREAAAAALVALWAPLAALGGAAVLPLFADPAAAADSARAAARLAAQAQRALRRQRLADGVRRRVAEAAAIHLQGNGTVLAMLRGAAAALDLQLGPVQHSADRYWHAATVADSLRLAHAVPNTAANAPVGSEIDQPLLPADELLGIEENPLWRDTTDNAPRTHAELFTVTRRGFERALLQVRFTGEANHSIGPILVNRDEGHGVGFNGAVPAGLELVFNEDGRVLLDGADVTPLAYAWQGACFADAGTPDAADAVFQGGVLDPAAKPATFVVTVPVGPAGGTVLDREATFPSAGESLPMPGIGVGITRLAFFVQQAHFASAELPAPRGVTPRTGAALFDQSVFASTTATNALPPPTAARVALSWLEHRGFAVRLLIPPRFRSWRADDADGVLTLQAVARAVERFRPLGVALAVEYIEDRWTLGSGTLTSGDGDDAIEALRAGTRLWAGPAPDAPPDAPPDRPPDPTPETTDPLPQGVT